jgi:hypothetical protein
MSSESIIMKMSTIKVASSKSEPEHKQFTIEELNVIRDALIFTMNCLDGERDQVQLCSSMKFVLAKIKDMLKQV